MAIVKEIKSGSAVVRIDDSCCRGLTPEETERRWAEVERAIQGSKAAAEETGRLPLHKNRATPCFACLRSWSDVLGK